MNAMMNEKGRQTKLLAAIAVLAMVVCALAMVMPSGEVDAVDATTNEAQIGDTPYPTFEAAVTAAADGDTIEILADVTVESCVNIADKSVTIELNNHTIHATSTESGMLISANAGSDVTINGPGVLSNTSTKANGVLTVRADASLEINNVTVNGKGYGIYVEGYLTANKTNDGQVTEAATHPQLRNETLTDDAVFATHLYVNNSTINTTSMPTVGTNGMYGYEYIEVNSSRLNTTEYTAMYIPSNAKVIVNNTTINASSGIDQRTGYLEINNSSITYTGAGQDKEQGDGPTDFGVGISVIDARGYSTADAVTIVNNVNFTGNDEGAGDIIMGVPRNNSETTDVAGILTSENDANRNGLLSVDGMEFTTKSGETIGVSYTDNGNVTIGKANTFTATENITIGEGKTFTIGEGADINVPSGSNLDLGNAKVTSKDNTWTLSVGTGSTVALPTGTTLPGTTAGDNVTVVGDASVTVGGTEQEIEASTAPADITTQEGLQNALDLGYPTLDLKQDVTISEDMVIDYPVVITSTSNGLVLDSADTQISFTNGARYSGNVTYNISGGAQTTVNVDLSGNFTLRAGSVELIDFNGANADTDKITVDSGDVFVLTGALNSKLTINANGGSIILRDLNITSSGSIYFVGNGSTVTAERTVSVYGQIMADEKITITVQTETTFRSYGGSVIQDTVTVAAANVTDETIIINLDGAMHTLTINDDINSSNTYGQTQTVVIGSTLDIVSGTTIIIQGQFVVNEGVTLTIQNGATLIINGTTSVMDVNGNIIIEDGGQLIVENSKAVDIAGSVQIYGDMNVNGGAVTVQENGNVTVTVDGTIAIAQGTTVKAGATVDILGQFDIDNITNEGTINLTGAVKTGDKDSKITLKNGGTVNVNSYTVGKDVSAMGLEITDGQNTITFTPEKAETGFSGAVITTASEKDENEKDVFTMSVSGSFGLVNNTDDNTVTVDVTVAGTKVAVSGDLTVGEKVAVANSAKLAVSGTVTATAGTFSNTGTIDVTGTITTKSEIKTGVVNAAYYSTTVTTGANAGTTYTYTTFENAVQSGATRVTVGVGSATVVVTDSVTVPGTVTNVTVSSNATLQIGAADNRDITVTVNDGSRVTGKIEVFATLTFDNSRNDNAAVSSDVVINNEPARTYTNLYTALASGAETVTIARNVELTGNITVPAGTTLVVPAGTGISFNEGVTMTVDGTVQTAVDFECLADKDGKEVSFTEKNASTTDNTAKIVVNGQFMSSVTDRSDKGMYDMYKIPGAYYDISNSTGAFTVIAPVATAAAVPAADVVGGSIVVYGEVSMGDVAFTGTEEDPLDIDVLGKSTGNVTLSYATLDIDAQFTGTVSTAVGAVELVNVIGIEVASVFEEQDDGTDVECMHVSGTAAPVDPKVDASMTVASGEVTVETGAQFTIAETQKEVDNEKVTTNSVALDIASGATMTVRGSVDVYDVTVDGTLVAIDNGRLVADFAYVFGTLTVAETDTEAKVDAGSAQIGTLYVGLDKKYDNMTAATVDGQVDGVKLMVVSAESTVSEGLLDDFNLSTAFNVEGSVWFTAYASGNSVPVTVDDVKVENALFIGWSDEENGDAIEDATSKPDNIVYQTTFNVGQYDTLYAVVDYEIYTVTITADAGIGTVAVDGKVLVKSDNVFIITGLTAGSHTIDYILNSGFEGTPTITVNGTAITGNTFTLSGTDDLTVEISIYGTQPAAPSQGGSTASGDDGMGLTDYLLIILVVLIVIMAIIVALRLMRS